MTTVVCPDCHAEIEGAVLACPVCSGLLFREKLNALRETAMAAEARQDWSSALTAWRDALELLPQTASQRALVLDRIHALSERAGRHEPPSWVKSWSKRLGPFGAVLLILWKLKAIIIAVAAKGKLLLLGLTKLSTLASMGLSGLLYGGSYGWAFGLGLVVSIYIHEMGHVASARRYGLRASASVFIPFVGAFILLKQQPVSAGEDARISLAGPIWGAAGALFTWLIFVWTQQPILGAIAHVAAMINLFNLMSVPPLDGSGAFRALNRGARMLVTLLLVVLYALTRTGLVLVLAVCSGCRCFGKQSEVDLDKPVLSDYLTLAAGLNLLMLLTAQ